MSRIPKGWTDDELRQAIDFQSVFGLLPAWAERNAYVGKVEIGAQLPTRDGRRHGNGVVVDIVSTIGRPALYVVVTDAGNEIKYSLEEIRSGFYPPSWIMKREEWPKVRDAVE